VSGAAGGPGAGRFLTPAVEVTEELRRAAVDLGGFTHPLFTRPAEVRLPQGSPLPGQAVLLLMGGLVEQSGQVDDVIALTGLREVSFLRPAVPGDALHVEVEVLRQTPRSAGRAVREMRWTAVNGAGQTLAEALVTMLVADPGTGAGQMPGQA
jgi:hypothetical protein